MVDEHAVAGADGGGKITQAAIVHAIGSDEGNSVGQEFVSSAPAIRIGGLYHVVQIVYHVVHMSYQTSLTINAPAERVWATMSDVQRWPESTPTVTSVTPLDDKPFGVGSRALVKQPKIPPLVWTVTEYEPLRGFNWQATGPGSVTVGRHWLTPGPGDAVTVTLGIERRGPLAWLVNWLYGGLTRDYVDKEIAGLKRVSEEQSRARSTSVPAGEPAPAAG